MPKGTLSIIGFVLLLFGFLSLVLGIIGLRLSFLSFLEDLGSLLAFLIKLGMIVVGIVLMYLDNIREENQAKK